MAIAAAATLEEILERGWLRSVFQPIVDLETGSLFESLPRIGRHVRGPALPESSGHKAVRTHGSRPAVRGPEARSGFPHFCSHLIPQLYHGGPHVLGPSPWLQGSVGMPRAGFEPAAYSLGGSRPPIRIKPFCRGLSQELS